MTNCGSRTVSGFNNILEEMFQYYVKSIITNNKGVASTFEVVRPGSRSGLLWVCQEVGVVSFCCRLHVLFYF